jgi:hypothetical protein
MSGGRDVVCADAFAGKRAPTIYGVRGACDRHKSVGAGLLANAVLQVNAVRQANAMSSVLTPSRASALLQFMAFAGDVVDTHL